MPVASARAIACRTHQDEGGARRAPRAHVSCRLQAVLGHERTREAMSEPRRRRTGRQAGDKASRYLSIAYAAPRPRGSAPRPCGRRGARCPGPWFLATPQARYMLARAQTWVPAFCRASRPQRCASWRRGARTSLGRPPRQPLPLPPPPAPCHRHVSAAGRRHPPHGGHSVGGCCVVLPPRPPCLPVILPTGYRHFFDSLRLPAPPPPPVLT